MTIVNPVLSDVADVDSKLNVLASLPESDPLRSRFVDAMRGIYNSQPGVNWSGDPFDDARRVPALFMCGIELLNILDDA